MKLTKKQAERVLPILKRAVLAQARLWDMENEMESELGRYFNVQDEIRDLAVNVAIPADTADFITIADVKRTFENV
jgi:hypothetical protein